MQMYQFGMDTYYNVLPAFCTIFGLYDSLHLLQKETQLMRDECCTYLLV